jgi:hypothetical protein
MGEGADEQETARRSDLSAVGIKGRRLMAAMDDDYMMEVPSCN